MQAKFHEHVRVLWDMLDLNKYLSRHLSPCAAPACRTMASFLARCSPLQTTPKAVTFSVDGGHSNAWRGPRSPPQAFQLTPGASPAFQLRGSSAPDGQELARCTHVTKVKHPKLPLTFPTSDCQRKRKSVFLSGKWRREFACDAPMGMTRGVLGHDLPLKQ